MKKVDLLKMDPEGVRVQARRDGLNMAILLQSWGIKPNAVDRWFTRHPQYKDEKVQALLHEEEEQHAQRILDGIVELAARRGSVTIFTAHPGGAKTERFSFGNPEKR